MSDWIKLHRKLKDKAFYIKDSEKVHLWIHILFKANFKQREEQLGGKPIICNPGQFTTGRKQLSTETGISESKIERILTYFEKIEQQIEQQKSSRNRLITVLNWEQYQVSEQHFEQQVNNNRTTSEQQVNNNRTHYNNVKNGNNSNNSSNKEQLNNIYRKFQHLKISIEENKKLIELGYNQNQINDIYDKIENYKQNIKYKSLFLTAKNWLKKEFKEQKEPIQDINSIRKLYGRQ